MHKDMKELLKAVVKLAIDRGKALKDVQPIVIEKVKKRRKRPKDTLFIVNGEVVDQVEDQTVLRKYVHKFPPNNDQNPDPGCDGSDPQGG